MSISRLSVLIFALFFYDLPAQKTSTQTANLSEPVTNIIPVKAGNGSPFVLELRNAFYDHNRNNLPYYLLSKNTGYNQQASCKLLIKKVTVANESHAAVIRKNFGEFIGKEFVLEPMASISRKSNLNHHRLIPFRTNAQGQIEELVSYEVTWNVTDNLYAFASKSAASFKSVSVLSSGAWYKIGITRTGIHKIDRAFLQKIGINITDLNPDNIRIYGNGGKMVPELNGAFRYDDLEENAVQVVTSNNTFDYLLFYATGTTGWTRTKTLVTGRPLFTSIKNMYSDTSFYYINVDIGQGKRIKIQPSLSQAANINTSTYDYYNSHEEDVVNLGKSGRRWFGEYFDIITSYSFKWDDGDFVQNDSLVTIATIIANHREPSDFRISGNGLNKVMTVGYTLGGEHAPYGTHGSDTSFAMNSNPAEINFTISKITSNSRGWLDKLTVNARRKLVVRNKQFCFRDHRVSSPGKIAGFSISSPSGAQLSLWNTSDPINPFIQAFNISGDNLSFVASADSLNEYCISPASDYLTPTYVDKVENQNIHNIQQADYLIITNPLFVKEAEWLGRFHQQKEGLSYVVVTTEQIYNEFGSGKPDISAIRDFIRMVYSRNFDAGTMPKYVLLLGDGSYNNRSRNLVNNSNLIPTYQSHESLSSTVSTCTDDFFGLMDPDEGFNAENKGNIDIGIGRFPCKTAKEVKAILDKIENYYRKEPGSYTSSSTPENCNTNSDGIMGDWRNWLIFLGDDEDGAIHMKQADDLTKMVDTLTKKEYNFEKIFLDAYQRFSTPGGFRYPDAAEDFVRRIKKGALIFNYTGHGGEVGLTAERMIDIDIINNLDNFNKLPLFITATCEFSRYDDPARTSAGELCLFNSKGGAIGLMTTSRLAFSNYNFDLNILLLQNLFSKKQDGGYPTLGEVINKTKSALGQNYYFVNFHLLGDPAMTLLYPEFRVFTSSINSQSVSIGSSDTLSALSKVIVTGFIADNDGKKMSSFNGVVYPTVFDRERTTTCLINSEDSRHTAVDGPFTFKSQKNMLYRGKSLVKNGDFSFTFLVPKDISIAYGQGRISYYATDGNIDAKGSYSQVVVGGVSDNPVTDGDGPQINLYLNDKNYVNGTLTNENPILYADLTDSSGINTVGNGIGHDISVILDENASKPLVLNDYYEASLNSYQSGTVRYPFNELSEGEHRLSFKVWDILNNSSTAHTDFIVAKSAELALERVLNYPNPFTTRTKFLFQHNQPCHPLNVSIQIYTISGKIVKTIQKSVRCEGFAADGIDWDGRDEFGERLGRGVYLYRLAIVDSENKKAEKIEKLVILN